MTKDEIPTAPPRRPPRKIDKVKSLNHTRPSGEEQPSRKNENDETADVGNDNEDLTNNNEKVALILPPSLSLKEITPPHGKVLAIRGIEKGTPEHTDPIVIEVRLGRALIPGKKRHVNPNINQEINIDLYE